MSELIEMLTWQANNNAKFLHAALADIPEHNLTHQPPGLPNHPLWQLGHLTRTRAGLCALLGSSSSTPKDFPTNCGPGSSPVSNPAEYPSKTELLAKFDAAHTHLLSLLPTLSKEQLAAPNPMERLRPRFPTLGQFLFALLTFHDALHIGQLTSWRRAQNLPSLI